MHAAQGGAGSRSAASKKVHIQERHCVCSAHSSCYAPCHHLLQTGRAACFRVGYSCAGSLNALLQALL
eukprot:1144174-Pelagomonas_calceolata.AAC.2